MKSSRLDGLQRIATGFLSPDHDIVIFSFDINGVEDILTRKFLFFIHSVDRDCSEGYYQPYSANFNILEENCPATYGYKRKQTSK